MLQELAMAQADGNYIKVMTKLDKTRLLLLDDLGLAPMTDSERRNFLKIIEERYSTSSTIVASQLPVKQWHEIIGDPTIADAILDRFVNNAHRIILKGESMRKKIRR